MKYFLSIDLGATNLRIGLFDENNSLIHVERKPSIKGDIIALENEIKEMISLFPTDYKIEQIGVSICGIVENNTLLYAPNLKVKDFEIGKFLKETYNVKVIVANDANASALAEVNLTNNFIHDDIVFFTTISSGIGGCLIYKHHLINLAFEIGHQRINYLNNSYDVESLLSGNGIVRLAKLNNLDISSAADFFKELDNNNSLAKKVLDIYTTLLSEFYFNIQANYNTDKIILSGGVMKSKKYFIDELKQKTDKLIEKYPFKKITFVDSSFDQNAGLYGGLALAKETNVLE